MPDPTHAKRPGPGLLTDGSIATTITGCTPQSGIHPFPASPTSRGLHLGPLQRPIGPLLSGLSRTVTEVIRPTPGYRPHLIHTFSADCGLRSLVLGGVGNPHLFHHPFEKTAAIEKRPPKDCVVRVGDLRAEVSEHRAQDGAEFFGSVAVET